MIEQIFFALLLGIIIGTITGIFPGIHINLVATLLFITSAFFLKFTSPIVLAVFIISMAIMHTFTDFVPSIFLGAPNEDTALSVLPGHRLLLEGYGYGAVKLTTIGGFFGILVAIAISPFFIAVMPYFYPFLVKVMAFILIAIVLILIIKEEKKIWAIIIFVISGILGIATLNLMVIKQPLFPLFSGLFGTSLLTMSFLQNVKIPKQKIQDIKVEKKEMTKILGLSILSSSLVSFLPGVGSAQAAVISSAIKKIDEKIFLVLVGAVNTIVMCLSFVALFSIQKPRSGVAVFVGKFLPYISEQQIWLLLLVALVVASIAVFVTLLFARFFARGIMKINYKWLCFAIMILLLVLTPIISGWLGLIIVVTGTAIGIITSLVGIKKIHMMGSLLLPIILYYII